MRFLGFRRRGSDYRNSLKIGVAGACNGAGTTHLCIMLANYYANVMGLETVVMEYNDHRDFLKICMETGKIREDYRKFVYRNITFVTGKDMKNTQKETEIMDRARVVILDCGCMGGESEGLFSQSDIRVGVLSGSLYRIACARRVIEKTKGHCMYMAAFGSSKVVQELSRETGVRVGRIPYEDDPFCITPGTAAWIDEVFGGKKLH